MPWNRKNNTFHYSLFQIKCGSKWIGQNITLQQNKAIIEYTPKLQAVARLTKLARLTRLTRLSREINVIFYYELPKGYNKN